MYGKVISACLHGIDGKLVEVEVDISNGLPQMNLVGLPDSAIRESVERVRAAVKNCGFEFPMNRITVNLAPADLKKEGCAFDLAIATGILATSGQLQIPDLQHSLFIGELSLDGKLRTVPGILSMIHAAHLAGIEKVIVPLAAIDEARLIPHVHVVGIQNLNQLKLLTQQQWWLTVNSSINNENIELKSIKPIENEEYSEDFADVQGQHQIKRAMMVAAAGMHNFLLIGPPGTGKTMLIRRLPSIMPNLSDEEALEVTQIYSAANQLSSRHSLIRNRPFRAPHHTVSAGGLVGGGTNPRPGEISLAHRGVLFLDELPEFSKHVLEVLRQPIESRNVTIARAKSVYTFPAHFIFAAAMNPCPCGYWGSESPFHTCKCTSLKIKHYLSKISGPLLDRIDIQIEVPQPNLQHFNDKSNQMTSREMAEKVKQAVDQQKLRYQHLGIRYNGELNSKMIRKWIHLTHEAEKLIKHAFESMGLSPRAYDRILKIARTIADLDHCEQVTSTHIAEAIQYRNLDRLKSQS
jgi:magnesium chelatase family protein